MDPIELLTKQHRDVDELFVMARAASGPERIRLIEEIADALTIHAEIEEQIFYPGVKNVETAGILQHSVVDHLQIKRALADMLDAQPEGDDFPIEPLDDLIGDVRKHVSEEENELFPKVKASIDAKELDDLGDRMVALADDLAEEEDVVERIYVETDSPAPL